jgi:NADP-dependent 3-hydroxy acid dehydrogenase YdfG
MSGDKKWAIVTGGSRGLGFETAKGLIAAGISVYIIGKDQDRAAESAKKLGCNYRSVDVSDSKSFAKF